MTKIVKNLTKKVFKSYFNGLTKLYEPCIKYNVYPFV